jgi:CTD kinase subunit beta
LQEVCLSTLYVSSKLHDTLKKPREIILASYPLRFPHLVKKASGSSGGGGTLDMSSVDMHALEAERGRVLGIERLVLEGVCFMFGVQGMEGVVRIARGLGCEYDL